MPIDDTKKDILTEYHEPLEQSGTDDILRTNFTHVTLDREDKNALFGHLHWGKVTAWFVNAYISPL
jgi:hypothetical protein